MGKHTEDWAAIWQFYTNFAVFKREIQSAIFKRYLHETVTLHTPTFYIKMNYFDIVFHIT